MKKVLLIAAAIILGLSSCKDDEYKEYEGTWAGTYTGGDTGSWRVNVDDEGKITGLLTPDSLGNFNFDITGSVNTDGSLSAEVNVFITTVNFTGTLSGNNGSGVWQNAAQGIQGTWTGTKQ